MLSTQYVRQKKLPNLAHKIKFYISIQKSNFLFTAFFFSAKWCLAASGARAPLLLSDGVPGPLALQLGDQGPRHPQHGQPAVEHLGRTHALVGGRVLGQADGVKAPVSGELPCQVGWRLGSREPSRALAACRQGNGMGMVRGTRRL